MSAVAASVATMLSAERCLSKVHVSKEVEDALTDLAKLGRLVGLTHAVDEA